MIEYDIIQWVQYNGQRSEITFHVDAMLPKQPFPSWKWNGEEWEAPTPKKYDQPYRWNEETLVWEIDHSTPSVFSGYEVT
jgi:hypothetical protein